MCSQFNNSAYFCKNMDKLILVIRFVTHLCRCEKSVMLSNNFPSFEMASGGFKSQPSINRFSFYS